MPCFLEVDRKQTLEERRPRLKSIGVSGEAGTYADKVKRVARLARKINTLTKAKVDKTGVRQCGAVEQERPHFGHCSRIHDLQGIVAGVTRA